MSCEKCKCGKKGLRLCPASFGAAVGISCGLGVFLWSVWVMLYGLPQMMVLNHLPMPTLGTTITHTFLAVLKGFVFGFVVALIYDLITCCCKCKCCRKEGVKCGCSCCSSNPEIPESKKLI